MSGIAAGQIIFIEDKNILWKTMNKVGSPTAWKSGITYKLGDQVVPRTILPGQENLMFQAVGFISVSGLAQPTWPVVANTLQVDGSTEWKTRDPAVDPEFLKPNEYYLIDETVTVTA